MRKRTDITYDEMDVKKIIHDELEKAKPDWIEEIVNRVSKNVTEKFDKVMTVLDSFAGEVQSYRQLQELNSNKLSEHNDQLEKHEEMLKKFAHPTV